MRTLVKHCVTLPILIPFMEVKRGKENPLDGKVSKTR
jgi:hypothetical protein